MSNEYQTKLRYECLLNLWGVRPTPISAEIIQRNSRRDSGVDLPISDIRAELVFLCDESLATRITDPLGVIRYRITSKGCTYWENRE